MENKIQVKYRNGLPTEKCLMELIDLFFEGDAGIYPSQSYKSLGTIVWQREYLNDKIDSLVSFLTDYGISIRDYCLYMKPAVGHIWITRKTNNNNKVNK